MREIAPPLYEGWRQPDAAMFASSWLRKVSNTCSSHINLQLLVRNQRLVIGGFGLLLGYWSFGLHARSPGRSWQ